MPIKQILDLHYIHFPVHCHFLLRKWLPLNSIQNKEDFEKVTIPSRNYTTEKWIQILWSVKGIYATVLYTLHSVAENTASKSVRYELPLCVCVCVCTCACVCMLQHVLHNMLWVFWNYLNSHKHQLHFNGTHGYYMVCPLLHTNQ